MHEKAYIYVQTVPAAIHQAAPIRFRIASMLIQHILRRPMQHKFMNKMNKERAIEIPHAQYVYMQVFTDEFSV